MKYEEIKLPPLAAFDKILKDMNLAAGMASYTITNITDLGAAANPNTSAILTGDGVSAFGNVAVTFNRLNVKNTFSKFGDVIRRPVIDVRSMGNITPGQQITLSKITTAIEKSLGLNLRTGGDYPDADGAQAVTTPAMGGYVDMDIVINKDSSLRFRPSSADKLPIRLRYSGVVWPAAMSSDDIRVKVPNPINDADHRLITYIPFGNDINAKWGSDITSLPFTSTVGYSSSGNVFANTSLTRLSATEYSVSDEFLLMPLYKNWNDLVSSTAATITAGAVATWAVSGMRDDVAMSPSSATGVYASLPNATNLRNIFKGENDWTIEFEATIPTLPASTAQYFLGTLTSSGWGAGDLFQIYASGYSANHVRISVRGPRGTEIGNIGCAVADLKPHTIAFTRQGRTLSMFLDGVLVDSTTITSGMSTTYTKNIMVGAQGSSLNFFKGTLRNLRIWNFAKINGPYRPLGYYDNAKGVPNIVSMAGKELDSSKWTEVVIVNPITTEPSGTSIRWTFLVDGKCYIYDEDYERVEIQLGDVPTMGMTTAFLKELTGHLSGNFIGSKFALVAALVTTDGVNTPAILRVGVSGRIPFAGYGGSVVSYPIPAQQVNGFRDDVGTQFNGNGINLGTHGNTASALQLGDVFGGQNDWTVEFDVARRVLNSRQTILWQRASSSSIAMSIYIGFTADNKIEFGYYPDAGLSWVGTTTTVTITDGAPHHVEVNRSGGVIRCFIDGKLAGSFAATGSNNAVPTSPYFIGRQATSETSWQGPLYAYLRDFCIYNYARHTSDYVVEPHVIISDDLSLNNSEVHPRQGRMSASALLYNVDFGPAIDSVGLSNIVAQSTSTALGGDVIVALNATLAANGIPITLPETVELNDMVVTDIRNISPDAAAGQNKAMNNVIVIKTTGIVHDNSIVMGSTLAFHMH